MVSLDNPELSFQDETYRELLTTRQDLDSLKSDIEQIHEVTKILKEKWRDEWENLESGIIKPSLESYAFAREGIEYFNDDIIYPVPAYGKFFPRERYKYNQRKKNPVETLSVKNTRYFAISDYDAWTFYVIDREDDRVISASWLHFSKISEKDITFDNIEHKTGWKWKSSMGFMLTSDEFRTNSTKRWEWLFLAGLEPWINDKVDQRYIAIHPASKSTAWCLGINCSLQGWTDVLPAEVKNLVWWSLIFAYSETNKSSYLKNSAVFQPYFTKKPSSQYGAR